MNIECHPLGPFETNSYLLLPDNDDSALVVDVPPGAWPYYQKLLAGRKRRCAAVWLTHGHWDHMADIGHFQSAGIPVLAHRGDGDWIERPELMLPFTPPGTELHGATPTRWVDQGDELAFGGYTFEVRHVPGHSPGGVVFYAPELEMVLGGDALFLGGVGRFDLPGGDGPLLFQKIKEQLFTLPPATRVLPGHGPVTTIEREMKHNPYVHA